MTSSVTSQTALIESRLDNYIKHKILEKNKQYKLMLQTCIDNRAQISDSQTNNIFPYVPNIYLTKYQLLLELSQDSLIGSKLLLAHTLPQSETHLGPH